jgi:hypothetical protein
VRNLATGVEEALTSAVVRPAYLCDVEFETGTLRLWTGVGQLQWGGNTYTGAGNLAGVSEIIETQDSRAEGIRLSLSGVPSSTVSLVLQSARQGRPVRLWLALFDESNAMIGEPVAAFDGLLDVPQIDDAGETSTISITAESRLIDLRRARVRRYTNEDQQLEYLGDLGFQYVNRAASGFVRFGGGGGGASRLSPTGKLIRPTKVSFEEPR